jgi:ligand-binding sensor domain-containing protein
LNDGDSLWLATRDGLVKYHKPTGKLTFYTQEQAGVTDTYIFGYSPPDNHGQIQGLLPGNGIHCLTKDAEGNIWMCIAGEGLVKFDGTKSVLYMQYHHGELDYMDYPMSLGTFILIDKENNKWIGGSGCLMKFDGSGFQRWSLPGMRQDTNVESGKFDKQGNLWIGARSRLGRSSLIRFDGITPISYPNINNDSYVFRPWMGRQETGFAIEIDEDDNVWIATLLSGLAKFDRDTTFTYYHAGNSDCPLYLVRDMKSDATGNLWMIGSNFTFPYDAPWQGYTDYVVKYDGTNFTTWKLPYSTENWNRDMECICMDIDAEGTLWIGTQQSGLIRFSNGEFTQIDIVKQDAGIKSFPQTSSKMINDSDSLWLVTSSGLVKYYKQTGKSIIYNQANAGLPGGIIMSMVKDKEGYIWLTSRQNGIGKFDGTGCQIYTSFNSELEDAPLCRPIAIDAYNNKWFAPIGIIQEFYGMDWPSWEMPYPASHSSNYDVRCMKFDSQGFLWIGGRFLSRNLYVFNGENIMNTTDPYKPFGYYNVNTIEFDNSGNKWLGTNKGVLKYDGENYTAYANSTVPFEEVEDIKKDVQGNLWLVGGKYLTKHTGTDFINYENTLLGSEDIHVCLEHDEDGSIWLLSQKYGLFHFKDGQFENVNYSQGESIDVVPVNSLQGIGTVVVYNLSGRLVLTSSEWPVDVSALPPGVYILKAVAGNEKWSYKVVVK